MRWTGTERSPWCRCTPRSAAAGRLDRVAAAALYRKTKGGIPEEQPDPITAGEAGDQRAALRLVAPARDRAALRGNAYGLVTAQDSYGNPTMIEWLDPNLVLVNDNACTGPGRSLRLVVLARHPRGQARAGAYP
jgi:hypothetical protein